MDQIYFLLRSLGCTNLDDYLAGFNCDTQAFDNASIYSTVGLLMIAISIIMAAVYYYGINSPRFNHRGHWLFFMLIPALINFVIAFVFSYSDFNNGVIGDCLMYERDADGQILAQLIQPSDCVMFGLVNAIDSAILYLVVSIGMKFGSRNCKCVPF